VPLPVRAMSRGSALGAPFLLGAYFVLNLAADNGAELVTTSDFGWPLMLSLLIAGLALLTGGLMTRCSSKAAIWAVAAVVLMSTFGLVGQAAQRHGRNADVFLLFGLLVLALLALWLRRTPRSLAAMAGYLAVVSGVLVGLTLIRLARQAFWPAPQPLLADSITTTPSVAQGQPDIYLVVVDKYTGSHLLRSHYGYDNTGFDQELRSRGFLVPREPRANYVNTFLALGAMLNFRYLDDLPDRFGRENPRRALAYPLVEQNALARFLQARGYRYVFFPSAFGPTRRSPIADVSLPSPDRIQPEFLTAWRNMTALPLLDQWVCAALGCHIDRMPLVPEAAALLDWKLDQLARLADARRPVFAFLHLAAPHEPYVYRADCSHQAPLWPPRDDGAWEPVVKRAYVATIQCLNRKLLGVVDTILRRSAVPPIILIQSDHGHARFGRSVPDLPDVPAERVAERLSVFAAYLLPGLRATEVWDTITPVNVTRLVLRHYFGAEMPPLPDRSVWSPLERPFRFTEIRR
jgi:hypothetical protein